MSKSALFSVRKHDPCPACGADLVIRAGKHGPFLGCVNYPTCDYIRPLKSQGDGHIVKVLEGHACPECGADKVLRQGRFGMFVGCSHYPECDYTETIDKPDETAIACPQCQSGKLVQRRSRYGKTFHSCDRYPDCQFAINATPVDGVCPHCQFPLLIEKKTAQGMKLLRQQTLWQTHSSGRTIIMKQHQYLPGSLDFCIKQLQQQAVIAYPTEAVFGLGCDPDSESAVMALLALKQRPVEKGLILIAADYAQLEPYIADRELTVVQRERMFASWPGPVTYVVPATPHTPRWLTGRFDSLAIRVSDHPDVQALCRGFGKPLVSTSANLSGEPPCRNAEEVAQQFGTDFPVLHAATGGRLNPSEIRDVISGELIRQG